MPSYPIPPLTVPAGPRVFGPFPVAGNWSDLDLVLDIANLTSMDALTEFSSDGGASWRTLVQETGLVPSISPFTALPIPYHLVAHWNPPLSAGNVRVTLDNAIAFLSAGGTLTLT